MTEQEVAALPSVDVGYDAIAEQSGVLQAAINEKQVERNAAMEKWKAENPKRYQEGLRAQRQTEPQRSQAAQTARSGAGGSGGGGASSIDTLLTSGTTQGVDPSALDLSKNTLLGL